jgi:hypothetical protein
MFAEMWMEQIAKVVGQPDHKVRQLNMYKEGDLTHFKQPMEHCSVGPCWDQALQRSQYEQRRVQASCKSVRKCVCGRGGGPCWNQALQHSQYEQRRVRGWSAVCWECICVVILTLVHGSLQAVTQFSGEAFPGQICVRIFKAAFTCGICLSSTCP